MPSAPPISIASDIAVPDGWRLECGPAPAVSFDGREGNFSLPVADGAEPENSLLYLAVCECGYWVSFHVNLNGHGLREERLGEKQQFSLGGNEMESVVADSIERHRCPEEYEDYRKVRDLLRNADNALSRMKAALYEAEYNLGAAQKVLCEITMDKMPWNEN